LFTWKNNAEGGNMKLYLQNFWKDTQGQDLVEYALLAALVSVAAVATLPAMGTTISNVFSKITSTLTSAVP
jgi:pilus assembly protein Flp/PilA